MAGRVFPMFSQNGVDNRYQVRKFNIIEEFAVPSILLFILVELLTDNPWLTFIICLTAFFIHIIRLAGWYNHQIWLKPLVWVLHVGYIFIAIGMLLSAFKGFYPQLKQLSIHAFTIGVIGTLTIGMIARVSLGHTGRNLHRPPKSLKLAFFAICVSAIVRIFMPLLLPFYYQMSIVISAVLWIFAFTIFFVQFFNYLATPRTDIQK